MNLKNLFFSLNLLSCLIVINAFIQRNITEIYVANIVGRNMTLRLKQIGESSDFEWQLIDPIINKSEKIDFSNSSKMNIYYKYWKKNSIQKYSFHFNKLITENSGKMLLYLTHLNNSKKSFSFNTIVFENPICSKYEKDSEEEIQVIEVLKNQNYIFSCSIISKWNFENENINLEPNISWDVEKQWKIFPTELFRAQYSKTSKFNDRIKFSRYLEYKVPDDDLKAWEQNNHQFFCNFYHEHFYNHNLMPINGSNFIATVSHSSKMPIQCKIQLNVQFKPFLHPNVSNVQKFYESHLALIECPIKANNHFPVKYYIAWYTNFENSSKFDLKLVQEYIGSADIYVIENPKYKPYHNSFVKCELYEIDQKNYHSGDYKKNIFLNFPKHKLVKLLLNATIKIEIIKKIWKNENSKIYSLLGISNLMVFVICLIEFLFFFGLILLLIYFFRSKISKKNTNFSKNRPEQKKEVVFYLNLMIF